MPALLLLAVIPALAATNDLTAALQQGLFEEEANHNLPEAIAAYQSVAGRFDENRKLAATAIFRLGECYRKQGNTNAAVAQYQRVLREFSDQAALVTPSQQNLAALGGAPANAGTPALSDAARQEQKRLFAEEVQLLEKKLEVQQKQIEVGRLAPDALWDTQRQILELKRQIAALDSGAPLLAAAPANSSGAPTSSEAEEVRRIQAMIKDSPDLINAPNPQDGYTPLQTAAGKGQLIVAQFLLATGADVEAGNPKFMDRTALMFASAGGHKAMVELLLNHKAKVDATDSNGFTALHLAAENGFRNIVEVLLSQGAQVNAKERGHGTTPLQLAVANGYKAVAELLLARGADVNAGGNAYAQGKNYYGTALHMAAQRGDAAMAELLLANKADPNSTANNGDTPLHVAAKAGNAAVATALLAHGADVNAKSEIQAERGWTPLVAAIDANQTEMVALLLKNKANPNVKFDIGVRPGAMSPQPQPDTNTRGPTPLLLAIWRNATRVIDLLLEAQADPNLQSDGGACPIFQALSASSGRYQMVRSLLERGARVDTRNSDGATPLVQAAWNAEPDLVRLFLAHQADPNAEASTGATPLHMLAGRAASNNYTSETNLIGTAELLLGAGAKVNLPDHNGQTPLSGLLQGGDKAGKLAVLLRQHGAVAYLPDFTALRLTRKGFDPAREIIVFRQDTNALNHFTLLEAIGNYFAGNFVYAHSQIAPHPGMPGPPPPIFPRPFGNRGPTLSPEQGGLFPFPDLANIRVHRPARNQPGEEQVIPVVLAPNQTIDCTKDVVLEFGDVVELPERIHSLADAPTGLTLIQRQRLKECLQRKVVFVVKGERIELTISPTENTYLSSALKLGPVQALLRSSSDFSRVRITRTDPGKPQPREIVEDVQPFLEGREIIANDLWLRDGDVVEVPDKPGAS